MNTKRTPEDKPARTNSIVRQRELLPLVRQEGFMSVASLAEKLGVSEMTVRRDLRALEVSGDLHRTHGGAVTQDGPLGAEPPFLDRQRANAEAKRRIALRAAELVREDDTIGIDVGSTTLQLAKSIVQKKRVRAFTTSLRAAMVLANSDVAVYTPGGQIRALEMSVTGHSAVSELANFTFDRVFLGVSGLSVDGVFDYSIEDSELKRAFIRQAKDVVVLADSSKYNTVSTVKISEWQNISTVISEAPPPENLQRVLDQQGVRLIVASA